MCGGPSGPRASRGLDNDFLGSLKAFGPLLTIFWAPLIFLMWGLAKVGHWPKNNKNRVQTFAGEDIWANILEK